MTAITGFGSGLHRDWWEVVLNVRESRVVFAVAGPGGAVAFTMLVLDGADPDIFPQGLMSEALEFHCATVKGDERYHAECPHRSPDICFRGIGYGIAEIPFGIYMGRGDEELFGYLESLYIEWFGEPETKPVPAPADPPQAKFEEAMRAAGEQITAGFIAGLQALTARIQADAERRRREREADTDGRK